MKRRTVAAIVAGGALAVGGTALASPGGGPLGLFGERDQEQKQLSRDLAEKLGHGVTPGEVDKALDDIRTDRRDEMLDRQAKALAAELDGVSAADVKKALAKAQREGDFLAVVAKELGKPESEVRKAFRSAHRKEFEQHLDDAVKEGRLTEKQADRIRKRMKSGRPFVMRFRHHGPGARRLGPPGPGGPPPMGMPAPPPPPAGP